MFNIQIISKMNIKRWYKLSNFQELYKKHEERLAKTDTINRAAKSILYKRTWEKYNIDSKNIKGYEGLKQLPFVSADDLRFVWENYPAEDLIVTETVGMWHCTSGSMGNKKWLPWTYNDYFQSKKALGDILGQKLKPHDIIMEIILSAPYLSGSVPYRLLEAFTEAKLPIEQLVMSPDAVQDSFGLLRKSCRRSIFS